MRNINTLEKLICPMGHDTPITNWNFRYSGSDNEGNIEFNQEDGFYCYECDRTYELEELTELRLMGIEALAEYSI